MVKQHFSTRWIAALGLCFVVLSGTTQAEESRAEPVHARLSTPGTLFICGGGILSESLLSKFVELAGGAAAKIVYIPTASGYAGTEELETKLTFWRAQAVKSFTILHTHDRPTADDEQFVAPLKEATGVWFMGGIQSRLTDAYLGTKTLAEVRGVLDRQGVVGGTSAGAAIMSPVMIRGGMPKAETSEGFGLLPGTVVDQHFIRRNRQGRLLGVVAKHPQLVGLGIDESTALMVQGSKLTVVGDSKVVVCMAGSNAAAPVTRELAPGMAANLVTLSREADQRMNALALKAEREPSDEPQSGK